jgi:hypothetical protein
MSEDKVKVTVLKGSVGTWRDGSYGKGETFIIDRSEANKIDPSFITIEELTPVAIEEVPVVVEEPKPEVKPTKKKSKASVEVVESESQA